MDFELSSEVISAIIFGMENQGEPLVFNIERCVVVLKKDVSAEEDQSSFVELPKWDPAQGFQLMEKFVTTLRNPVYRELLKDALSSGKGVFRKFKDALKQREDIRRLWFSFKEKEMRKRVLEWYEITCECFNLQKAELPAEETEDLILTDFIFRPPGKDELIYLRELDRLSFEEIYEDMHPFIAESLFETNRNEYRLTGEEGNNILCSVTPNGQLAGFIWGEERGIKEGEECLFSVIVQLYVDKNYRGLGVASLLFTNYLDQARKRGVDTVMIELKGNHPGFKKFIENTGFFSFSNSYSMKLL